MLDRVACELPRSNQLKSSCSSSVFAPSMTSGHTWFLSLSQLALLSGSFRNLYHETAASEGSLPACTCFAASHCGTQMDSLPSCAFLKKNQRALTCLCTACFNQDMFHPPLEKDVECTLEGSTMMLVASSIRWALEHFEDSQKKVLDGQCQACCQCQCEMLKMASEKAACNSEMPCCHEGQLVVLLAPTWSAILCRSS